LYCLSFFMLRSLYCLSFFDLQLLIITLVSTNFTHQCHIYMYSLTLQLAAVKLSNWSCLLYQDLRPSFCSHFSWFVLCKTMTFKSVICSRNWCQECHTLCFVYQQSFVCPSSIYSFWLSLWYLQTLLTNAIYICTHSHYNYKNFTIDTYSTDMTTTSLSLDIFLIRGS
jgi:hypothetical protein